MKLTTTLFLIFTLLSVSLNAQDNENNSTEKKNSYIDLGAGVGPNYGIFGLKSVIGYNGSGLLFAVGSFDGYTTTTIGAQLKYKIAYMSLAYGAYGSYEVRVGNRIFSADLLEGVIFMVGVQPTLTKNKRLFVDLGLGYAGGGSSPTPFGGEIPENRLTFSAGLGYSIF